MWTKVELLRSTKNGTNTEKVQSTFHKTVYKLFDVDGIQKLFVCYVFSFSDSHCDSCSVSLAAAWQKKNHGTKPRLGKNNASHYNSINIIMHDPKPKTCRVSIAFYFRPDFAMMNFIIPAAVFLIIGIILSKNVKNDEVLNRQQTDEWKGMLFDWLIGWLVDECNKNTHCLVALR